MEDLPSQLQSVPIDGLPDVLDALALLQDVGFDELVNVDELSSQVNAVTEQKPDHYETQYMAMCDWASTRNKWRESSPPEPDAGCQLAMLPSEEADAARSGAAGNIAQKHEELKPAVASDAQAFFSRWKEAGGGSYGEEELQELMEWLEEQFAAQKALEALVEGAWEPTIFGDGASVFFKKQLVPEQTPSRAPKLQGKAPRCVATSEALHSANGNNKLRRSSATQGIVTVHVGGAGCGMGKSFYERLMSEHRIDSASMTCPADAPGKVAPHFQETSKGRLVPRAILVDRGEDAMDKCRATNNFAPFDFIGFSDELQADLVFFRPPKASAVEAALDSIRRKMEECDAVSTMMITHSMLGATGSGLTSAMLERICAEYNKKQKWAFSLSLPFAEGDGGLTPGMAAINMLLTHHAMVEHVDQATYMDNGAMWNLCSGLLGNEAPTHEDFNATIARTMASVTSSLRIGCDVAATDGARCVGPGDLLTGLAMYPRLHFTVPSLAPLAANAADISMTSLAQSCLSSVDLSSGKHCSIGLLCRGVPQLTVLDQLMEWKASASCNLVSHSPAGVTIGCHSDPTLPTACEVVAFHNSTAIQQVFSECFERAGSAWEQEKASFLAAGISEGEYSEAREDMSATMKDFEEVGQETAEFDEEE